MKNKTTKHIPHGWEIYQLSQIGEFKNGVNKSKQDFGYGSPFVNLMDIFGYPSIRNKKFGLVNVSEGEIQNYSLKKSDVLFVRSSVKSEGVGLATLVEEDLKNTVYSGFIIRFRSDNTLITHGFKKYSFQNSIFRNKLMATSSVSANTNINQGALNKLPILLPPLLEQNRIVTVLETWDRAIETLAKKIEIKKNIKKGLMKELLPGRKRFSGFVEKWKPIEIGNFCDIKRGGSPRPIQNYMTEEASGLNWLKIGDVSKGSRYIFKTTGKIKKEGLNRTTMVNEGDFILSNSMSFGRPYIMKLSACIHDGWLALKNISENVNKDFLYYLLSSEIVQAKFKSISAGSGVLNLKKETVSEVVICIPSLPEQTRIAQLLTSTDDEIDKLEQKLNIITVQKSYLLNNLITGEIRTPENLTLHN